MASQKSGFRPHSRSGSRTLADASVCRFLTFDDAVAGRYDRETEMELSDNCRNWLMAPAVEGRKLSRGRIVFEKQSSHPDASAQRKGRGSWCSSRSFRGWSPAGCGAGLSPQHFSCPLRPSVLPACSLPFASLSRFSPASRAASLNLLLSLPLGFQITCR